MGIQNEQLKEAADMILQAKHLVALTGAGISAESGIPTFRGGSGLWELYDPEEVASMSGFRRNPEAFWEFAQDLLLLEEASPNPGHEALAWLESAGYLNTIITQNIDFLHQKAGSKSVLELHGSLQEAKCLDCGREYKWSELTPIVKEEKIPICDKCESKRIKPDIVFFGEQLPQKTVDKAWKEVNKCDLMLVIGTSLIVYPAASLPSLAKERGADLIYNNKGSGEQDEIFDLVLTGPAARVLPRLIKLIKQV
ncbi:MAG: SIR2 family NAD-dependent protein deacylase [Bacillota bacterium]